MFNYRNKTSKYINKEVDLRVGKLTSQGLIKSEEEYKKVIDNMIKTINSDLGRVTDPRNYQALPDQIVSSNDFRGLFTDLESDLRILHRELKDAHKILDMSLTRNMVFFRRIKNKIASMWKELSKMRETSFNIESADYTFFESFDSSEGSMILSGLSIDKKTGEIQLTPLSTKTHYESKDIQEVAVTMYPPENTDGGVYQTTSPANKIDLNYDKGTREMMKSGLWKIQLLTADIPRTNLDPLGKASTTSYSGLVAYVDITFTGPKLINEIGFDPYGEFKTKILGVRYKKTLDSQWENMTTTDDFNQTKSINGSSSDWIYMRNINPVHARVLRLVVHQENHSTVSKLLSKVDTMVDKVVRDLVERRYSKSAYNYKFTDEMPRVSDQDKDRGTLYDDVMRAIEEEQDIETVESKIQEILVPQPAEIDQNIQNWKIYNTGAWSIEPKTVQYPPSAVGVYISHDPRDKNGGFKLAEGSPTEATLYTRQTEPAGTIVEWYLLADNGSAKPVEIPIIPNNDLYRTEVVSIGKYYPLDKDNTNRSSKPTNINQMIKVDFPIHPAYLGEIIITENGKEIVNENSDQIEVRGKIIETYNSTELYIPDVDIKPGNIYSIKYIPALIDCVRCYVLVPSVEPTDKTKIDVGTALVFANEGMAEKFAKNMSYVNMNEAPEWVVKSESYNVKSHLCTKHEFDSWFESGRVPMFVDEAIDNDDKPGVSWLPYGHGKVYKSAKTRLTWLFRDNDRIKPFSDNQVDNTTWSELIAAPPVLSMRQKHYDVVRG